MKPIIILEWDIDVKPNPFYWCDTNATLSGGEISYLDLATENVNLEHYREIRESFSNG